MSIYNDLLGNITDRFIDGAVDNAIDTVKGKNTLTTTYVWTCINKETHNGKIANLTFINKLGQRRRVPYDRVGDFCASEYVSNVIVEDSKVNIVGCSIYDLPDFKLDGYGGYALKAKHDENWVYNKALPYIQSQERLIQEDYKNKCLKTDKNTATQSNITGNISAIRDISTATAVTAVTAAGTAAVTGAVFAGKAIYNQVNKKKASEQQEEICKKLSKYSDIIQAMLVMKYKTNNLYKNNKDLLEYNNNIDARNETSGTIARDIHSIGVAMCIQKASDGLKGFRSKAVSLKINNLPIKITGISYGTIDNYIDSLENNLESVRQLHEETKTLLNNNIQLKQQKEYNRNLQLQRQQEQIQLRNSIETDITDLESIINNINYLDINDNTIEEIERHNINDRLEDLSDMLSMLDNTADKQELLNRFSQINNINNNITNNITQHRKNILNQAKQELNQKLTEAEHLLDELILGTHIQSDYSEALYTINEIIINSREQVNNIDFNERESIKQRIESLSNKKEKNGKTIELNVRAIERQKERIIDIETDINKFKENIRLATNLSDIQHNINRFNSASSMSISYIKNAELLNKANEIINTARGEFTEIYNNKFAEETEKANMAEQRYNELYSKITEDLQHIEELNPSIITKETIEELKKLGLNNYLFDISNLEINTSKKSLLKNKAYDIEYSINKKRREYESILSKENTAKNKIETELYSIQSKLNETKPSINNLITKINRIKQSIDYKNLQITDWVDTKIEELLEECERKQI